MISIPASFLPSFLPTIINSLLHHFQIPILSKPHKTNQKNSQVNGNYQKPRIQRASLSSPLRHSESLSMFPIAFNPLGLCISKSIINTSDQLNQILPTKATQQWRNEKKRNKVQKTRDEERKGENANSSLIIKGKIRRVKINPPPYSFLS